jgi:hypothetical protein
MQKLDGAARGLTQYASLVVGQDPIGCDYLCRRQIDLRQEADFR